ncbi:helix-turn-helix DNA binding domain protein [Rhodobacter phage RcWaterboi]|nr:helix-turn-helix DNA binding domain protein [Rhodobacter phage RcWaterboi]
MANFGPGELQMAVLQHLALPLTAPTIQIALALGVTSKRVSKAAASLVDRGYISRDRPGIYKITFRGLQAIADGKVITSGPVDASGNVLSRPETNGFRDRVWRSMRLRGIFTIEDVVCDAVDGEKDAINDAGRYVRILRSAGYVIEMPDRRKGTRPRSNGMKRFRLDRNTGPRAPLYRSKLGLVHDFNTGEDFPCR